MTKTDSLGIVKAKNDAALHDDYCRRWTSRAFDELLLEGEGN
jgi:hypothetical protein